MIDMQKFVWATIEAEIEQGLSWLWPSSAEVVYMCVHFAS